MIVGLKKENLIKKIKWGGLVLIPFFTLISCDNDIKNIQKLNQKKLFPSGEAKNMLVRYTDSAKIKAELKSATMLDYSSAKYGFSHFPKKVFVTVFDDKKQKTLIEADKATSFNKTKIIELIGNVKIITSDGKILQTNQLYYDQRNNWFFTESYFKITDPNKSYFEGIGLDFDNKFKIINAQQNRGELNNIKNENL